MQIIGGMIFPVFEMALSNVDPERRVLSPSSIDEVPEVDPGNSQQYANNLPELYNKLQPATKKQLGIE